MESYAAWPDLTYWPLQNPDLELYTDGSSFVKNCVRLAGFAVVTEFGIHNKSSKTIKEQRVNIYTVSKYAFLILHAHAAIWKERGMLTMTGAASHKDKREVTLIVLGIPVTSLTVISYGVIANHVIQKT
jgi:hypothetical protein